MSLTAFARVVLLAIAVAVGWIQASPTADSWINGAVSLAPIANAAAEFVYEIKDDTLVPYDQFIKLVSKFLVEHGVPPEYYPCIQSFAHDTAVDRAVKKYQADHRNQSPKAPVELNNGRCELDQAKMTAIMRGAMSIPYPTIDGDLAPYSKYKEAVMIYLKAQNVPPLDAASTMQYLEESGKATDRLFEAFTKVMTALKKGAEMPVGAESLKDRCSKKAGKACPLKL